MEMTVEEIPGDIKVLVVVHPKGITDKTQYAIDQFILKGGKVVAFLDPFSLVDSRNTPGNPMQQAAAQSGSTLDKLLKVIANSGSCPPALARWPRRMLVMMTC